MQSNECGYMLNENEQIFTLAAIATRQVGMGVAHRHESVTLTLTTTLTLTLPG